MRTIPSRRLVLRSAGATLALPFLHSAMPRAAWAATPAPPKRALYYFIPNGLQPEQMIPTSVGPDWAPDPEFGGLLSPLVPVQSKLTLITGLNQPAAEDTVEGDHARGTGAFLSCSAIKKTAGSDIANAVTIDQLMANEFAGQTPFPSMQVGTEAGGSTGDCNAGYSCAYTRNLSWAGTSTPLPPIVDPIVLFERMFGPSGGTQDPAAQARQAILRGTVLDSVSDQIADLQKRLSSSDRYKLDEYLAGVESVTTLISQLGSGECGDAAPPASTDNFPDQLAVTHDMMVLALRCDMTRILSFMFGQSASNRSFGFMGVNEAHHQLSHHQNDATKLQNLYDIESWIVQNAIVDLIQRMDAVIEDDGQSLLFHSSVYFGSEISDGNTHSHTDLAVILAGQAGGALTTGNHLYEPDRVVADVLLATAAATCSSLASFADSSGVFPGLLA